MSITQNSLCKKLWLPFAISTMVILALLREIAFFPIPDMIPNPDSSWLIYAAGRMADGQKPYVDFMETNPPLILWISLLPVLLGKILGLSPFTVFPLLVTLLNLASMWLVAKVMRGNNLLGAKPVFGAVLLYIAFGFFLLSPAVYGQRELLFITLVLPYLIKSLFAEREEKSTSVDLIIILMAAIGFALKPFFLLLWGLNELHKAIQERNFLSIFALRNWLIGCVQLLYFAAIYYLAPEYINTIIPAIISTYFAYETLWYSILKIIAIICGLALLLAWMASPHSDFRKIIGRMVVWMFACAMLMVVQRKDWLNHLYPMVFMAGLVIVMVLLYLVAIWQEIGLLIGRTRFLALCVGIATLLAGIYVDGKFWYFIYKHPSVIHTRLLAEIDKHADGKYVYSLAFNMQSAFPVIALSKGVFHGSFYQLWPMSGLIIREQEGKKTEDIVSARKFFYDNLVHDFSSHPPELVWVDENVNLEKIADYDIEPENRDIIKVLSRDVRFFVLWQNYEKIGEIEGNKPDNDNLEEGEKPMKPERYSLYKRIKKDGV
ncbi:MAG: hypothetical protein ABL867_01665 [Rickettsiales bacterium]